MGVLTVYLDKIINLVDTDLVGKADPYVKFHLEQDNWVFDKTYGRVTSSKKKEELNPVYHEEFTFDDLPSLKNMVLRVKVMDDDILFDDKMGSCNIKLDELGLGEEALGVERVIDRNLISKNARIFLQLSYTQ
mmetsp:Transcript_68789/g.108437  ORF Transcript_68789/g.108437 Transcript_68789/m.108437 type:complete len:133 (+) Transcript_68789:115-513(+)